MNLLKLAAVALIAVSSISHAETLQVTSLSGKTDLNDDLFTLGDAITVANTLPGPDRIVFAPGLKGVIKLKRYLEVTESLEIAGPGPSSLTLYMDSSWGSWDEISHIFVVSGATENFSLSGVTLKRNISSSIPPMPLVSMARNTVLTGMEIDNFQRGVNTVNAESVVLDSISYHQSLAILDASNYRSEEALDSNIQLRNIFFKNTRKSSTAIIIQQDTGSDGNYQPDRTSLTIDNLRVTDSKEFRFSENGETELTIQNSSFDNNEGVDIVVYGGGMRIINSTVYNNKKTQLLFSNVASGEIAFSTILYNGGQYNGAIVKATNSGLDISNSVISGTHNGEAVINSSSSAIAVSHSLIGLTSVTSGAQISYDAASLSRLLSFPEFEGILTAPDSLIFSILPASPGNLIDAGDPTASPGVDNTPEFDSAGSVRVIGSAPDIGAIEYNRRPQFDLPAFKEAIKQARRATPDDIIEIALLDYFSDPDGHTIIDIEVFFPSDGLSFDTGSWVLSGTAEAFAQPELVVIATDEYQLKGGATVSKPSASAPFIDDGDGGSITLSILLLLATLSIRRRGSRRLSCDL